MKRGFSLVMAVLFVVLIATLGMAALSFATSTTKQATNVFLRDQAEILARSATEIAVMAMQDHNYSTNCLEKVNVFYPDRANALLKAEIRISYFDSNLTNCNNIISTHSDLLNIGKPDNIALFDILVKSMPEVSTEQIRFYKRVLQRP